jgi:hypothetical protein
MKLPEIAADMRQQLDGAPYGHITRPLSGGLKLVLKRNDNRWRLTLRRINVYPSDRELAIYARAFGIPEGTEPARRLWQERVSAHDRVTWYCIDLIWREVEAPVRLSSCPRPA